MDKHRSKLLIPLLFTLAAATGTLFVVGKMQSKNTAETVPPAVDAQEPRLTSVISPNSKSTLTMNEKKKQDTTLYSFLIKDLANNTQKEIFTATVPLTTTLSIPYNTFSPDNKYLFLKEENSGQANYFVLATSKETGTQDNKTLNISDMFAAKFTNFKITEVTGWGGPTLVVINTDKEDGSLGPSFWFDVSSHAFIQLSTRFN